MAIAGVIHNTERPMVDHDPMSSTDYSAELKDECRDARCDHSSAESARERSRAIGEISVRARKDLRGSGWSLHNFCAGTWCNNLYRSSASELRLTSRAFSLKLLAPLKDEDNMVMAG
ncbi:hypothetical protein N7492_005091 [Penicillium capsulatum]|uniref:Uncharacterized protein n=1 Tax=Penicillium capsulatum TaxID=69766 RepID=A0A9W9IB77_9EURO|nr:hypothetical protein N7492_005091 [Penicillium capsulatum]